MSKKDLVVSLQYIIDTVNDALEKKANRAAFISALTIPDICAQIQYSRNYISKHDNNEYYAKWYDENVYVYENPPGAQMNQLSGDVVYLLRCKMFHEGSVDHRSVINKLRCKYAVLSAEKYKEDFPDGVDIDFKINMFSEYESISVGYSHELIGHKIIKVQVNVNQTELAKKLMWNAEGVIREFNKKI